MSDRKKHQNSFKNMYKINLIRECLWFERGLHCNDDNTEKKNQKKERLLV